MSTLANPPDNVFSFMSNVDVKFSGKLDDLDNIKVDVNKIKDEQGTEIKNKDDVNKIFKIKSNSSTSVPPVEVDQYLADNKNKDLDELKKIKQQLNTEIGETGIDAEVLKIKQKNLVTINSLIEKKENENANPSAVTGTDSEDPIIEQFKLDNGSKTKEQLQALEEELSAEKNGLNSTNDSETITVINNKLAVIKSLIDDGRQGGRRGGKHKRRTAKPRSRKLKKSRRKHKMHKHNMNMNMKPHSF